MLLFILIALLFIFFSAQPLLLIYSFALLFILYKLFWRANEPKVIFVGLVFFWISIVIKVLYADIVGVLYEDLSLSPQIVETTFIALIALLVFALGVYFTSRNIEKKIEISYTETFNYSTTKVLTLYVATSIISTILKGILFVFPGFSQLFAALIAMKTGLLFLLIHTIYAQKKQMWVITVIVGAEIVLSFVSFFSNFKDILISLAVVFSFYPIKLSVKQYLRNILLAAATLYLLLIWQTIKGEYRFFLNQGTKTQSVQVSTTDALSKIAELAQTADPFNKDNNTVYESIDRLSYIEFFSQSMIRVPQEKPHENGALWLNNIMHVLVPRIFNPNKKAIDDSEMVNAYCIRQVATSGQGASWSLGFVAESYIDFGIPFMFLPIFLVGCLLGWVYKLLITKSINFVWGFSMVVPLWVYINCNGTPGTKILGRVLMYLIAFYLIRRFVMKPVDKFLKTT
jgi:hypothetical protein